MKKSQWNGFERLDFTFEGREAILVFPKSRNESGSWMLKTEYFGAFPGFEVEMLKRGWHLAYIKNKTRWAQDDDLDMQKRFADHLHAEYRLNTKFTPVGMSCGGLIACKLAAKYPERIAALYLDAPVMNLLSCPADIGVARSGLLAEFLEVTGMTLSELICYREHPIDKMDILLKNSLPIVLVYGDADDIVPYAENGFVLEKYYKESGGKLLAIGKSGCGHHPHGLNDSTPIIEFIENNMIL